MAQFPAVGQELWIVASAARNTNNVEQNDKKKQLGQLQQWWSQKVREPTTPAPVPFAVPDGEQTGLVFGSFDNLIRLTDELQKCDQTLDSTLHRMERQLIDLDPKAVFEIKLSRGQGVKPVGQYIMEWQWDEAKYPRTRSIADNLSFLMGAVSKLDDETRSKSSQYGEAKSLKANLARKEGTNLNNLDLVDVLTPEVVDVKDKSDPGCNATDDFISSDHICTVCVILSKSAELEFSNSYMTFGSKVVPGSAKKLEKCSDKDGNSLWRVVMFKSCADEFKKNCRVAKFATRDFEYSADAYQKLLVDREAADVTLAKQYTVVKGMYQAGWSDVMIAWMHIKAMRVFVESVLRFGIPPTISAFVVSTKNRERVARQGLTEVLGGQKEKKKNEEKAMHNAQAASVGVTVGSLGGDAPATTGFMEGPAGEEETDEYHPYVSFSITPFVVPR